jgi:hypothetical protein
MIRSTDYREHYQGLTRTIYHAPKLRVYGAVKELTGSGTQGVQEKGGATDNPQKRP